MRARDQSSILVLAGNFALTIGVIRSYSSRPFLCALGLRSKAKISLQGINICNNINLTIIVVKWSAN